MNNPNDTGSFELSGLDGANPLGYLAALGTAVTLRQAGHVGARLRWRRSATWLPVLECSTIDNRMVLNQILSKTLHGDSISASAIEVFELTDRMFESASKVLKEKMKEIKKQGLRGSERKTALETEIVPLREDLNRKRQAWLTALKDVVPSQELAIGKHIDCKVDEYRAYASDFLDTASHSRRDLLDIMAAFGTDACLGKSERIIATPFCFITGSGHQYFLDTVCKLMSVVTPERIDSALFEPWKYQDEKLSMRWDPSEDRRYALMNRDPTASNNKTRTVWMANLLAYKAIILFPSAPKSGDLVTTAWGHQDDVPTFTWPLWEFPTDIETIYSMLQLEELTKPEPDILVLRARGISSVFRARRIQVGRPPMHKINFSPAKNIF